MEDTSRQNNAKVVDWSSLSPSRAHSIQKKPQRSIDFTTGENRKGLMMSKHGAAILVVDDEKEILRALQRSLSAHGYKVLTATNGEEAVEAVSRLHPDL